MRAPRKPLLSAVAAALALLVAPALASAASPADWMYEPATFAEIELTLPPSSYQELEEHPEDEYVRGTFSIARTGGAPGSAGAFSTPIEVGIRLKGGEGSFLEINEKAGFKIKFNKFVKGQTFDGLEKLTLNNMAQDESMLHETLAYQAFRELGVPAPHTGFAYLRVNGKSYGLHLNIETQDKDSLEKQFGPFLSPPQHLYEGEYGADVNTELWRASSEQKWEKLEVQEGKSGSKADLQALVTKVGEASPPFAERVAAVADLNEMTRMWVGEKYTGHFDGYSGVAPDGNRPNNYYLYSDAGGKFQMLPWGTDQTWVDPLEFEGDGGTLFHDCLADSAGCRQTYLAAAGEALNKLSGPGLEATARCTAQRLRPWQEYEATASEAEKLPPYNLAAMATAATQTRGFVENRPGQLAAFLGTIAPPVVPAQPCTPPPSSSALPMAPPNRVFIGPSRPLGSLRKVEVTGKAVLLHFTAVGPGTLRIKGILGPGHRRGPVVCSANARFAAAATRVLACKLNREARELRRRHWQVLRIAARFHAPDGSFGSISRRLHLRRG